MNIHYSRTGIEHLAQNVLKSFDETLVNSDPMAIPIEEVMEFQYKLRIHYVSLSKQGNIHGLTMFDDGTVPTYDPKEKRYVSTPSKAGDIFIEKKLLAKNRVNRLRFTLAHELAHWLIHQENYVEFEKCAYKTSTNSHGAIEREADYLAAALLMPQGRVRVAFKRHKSLVHDAIVPQLSSVFQVSPQAMAFRLSDLNLIGRRYEDVAAERSEHTLRCPRCSSPVCDITSTSKPFAAEAAGIELKILCPRCGDAVNIKLENT